MWRGICGDDWTHQEGDRFCSSYGYTAGGVAAILDDELIRWPQIRNVNCTGVTSFDDCNLTMIEDYNENCTTSAAVMCIKHNIRKFLLF